jgi:capsular polysaccharide biosynthesis protein/tetratricopeptide (TPR) repeat protein
MTLFEESIAAATKAVVQRDWATALGIWEAVAQQYPESPEGFVGKASALIQLGRLAEAEALLLQAMEGFPSNIWASVAYAQLAERQQDWRAALRRWEAVRDEFPDAAVGHTGTASALRELGELDAAETAFAQAAERFPHDPWAAQNHAVVAARRGDWPEALRRWQAMKRKFPDHSGAHVGAADALRRLGELDESDRLFAEAVEKFPSDYWAAIGYAQLAAQRHRWDEAIRRWDLVLQRFPQDIAGYVGKAETLLPAGCFDELDDFIKLTAVWFPADPRFAQLSDEAKTRRRAWEECGPIQIPPHGMWISRYNRNLMHPELDHSEFGVAGDTLSLLDASANTSFIRTIVRFPDQDLPEAPVFGGREVEPNRGHLQACRISCTAGYTEPVAGTMFMPDHAFIVDEGNALKLIQESFWHSELYLNRYARNDISTEWKWRFDRSWQVSETVEDAVYLCHHRSCYQYFHWIMDALPRVWLFCTTQRHQADKWFAGPLDQKFHLASLALYDIGPEQCVTFAPDQVIHFKRAMVPAFEFLEPLKTMRPDFNTGVRNVGWSTEYLHDLRDRGRAKYGSNAPADLKIFVSRSDAEHRRAVNDGALTDFVRERGFTIVTPGELSFAEQVELFGRARLILGIHGAGLTNLVWAPQNCTILELAPEGLRDVGYRFSAQLCGHHFAVIPCETFEHPQGLPYSDIMVDLDIMAAALRDAP